jgi:two-component system, OmpR family, alkaline phosphatase synthesis response regulator PhoP
MVQETGRGGNASAECVEGPRLDLDRRIRLERVPGVKVRILVVEDDASLADFVQTGLQTVGYVVAVAPDLRAGLAEIENGGVDLLILDLTLPDGDGMEILGRIGGRGIPVVILTARDGLRDKVRGLELGADDYVTKPFELLELIARIKTVLRRAGKDRRRFTVGGLTIDADARTVSADGRTMEVPRQEFDLLLCLAEHRGIALTRDKLLELAWGYDYPGSTRTVDVHVQRLREKIGQDAIRTVPGIGYRMEG